MNYEISKAFQKDFNKLKDKKLAVAILASIDAVAQAKEVKDIPNLKKLKGYKTAYRIRVGDYRIGIFIEANYVLFQSFDNRKDIYKNFP
jgi:mRNA interferase RelE/StbE